MAFRLLAARLAVNPDQVPVESQSLAVSLDQVAEVESAACCLVPAATLDQDVVEPQAQSDAWPLAAKSRSEARPPGVTE